MKVLIFLVALVAFVFAGPVKTGRIYFPEEDNEDFKRYIHLENDKGILELVDLKKADVKPLAVTNDDVSYDLYTRKNPNQPYKISSNDIGELEFSNFDSSKVSLFVAHGWRSSRDSGLNPLIRDAALENHDVNVFIIDWSPAANTLYLSAKDNVVPVGKIVGNFINDIQTFYGLTGSSFVLVGHSLGAHVVGNAGAIIKNKIDHIIGMDPAGPLFTVSNTDNRLDSSDGNYVQVIHTNGAVLGFASSIGDADYYPNGGMNQPGCGWDVAGACAHSRSYEYYAESLKRGPVFGAVLCSNFDDFQNKLCSQNHQSFMGDIKANQKAAGDYFLETNHEEPFGLA